MSKTKELIICIISLIVLTLVFTINIVNAISVPDLIDSQKNDIGNIDEEPADIEDDTNTNINTNTNKNTNANTNTNTNTNSNTNINVNTNKNTNTPGSMPNSGVDYSIVFIIAICGVSAIYAYKKIRDYNNV